MVSPVGKMNAYVPVKIPRDLVDEVDKRVGTWGFKSRQEFVREAVRRLLTALHGMELSYLKGEEDAQ